VNPGLRRRRDLGRARVRCRWLALTTLALAAVSASAVPASVQAGEPDSTRADAPIVGVEGPPEPAALAELAALFDRATSSPGFELEQPSLLAYLPGPASFVAPPPVYAQRGAKREFDTSMGERDPRKRQRPRTHRFRLALHAQWVRLTRTENPATGEFERFHFAPLLLDLGYQAQFLKVVMVRIAVAAGGNVANSRHAMPGVVMPQIYAGYQGKIMGAAIGYGFDWTIPPSFGVRDPARSNALLQPVITRNHVVTGELSATSKIDRTAMTFALAIGGMQSDLSHYDTVNRRWRMYLGFQAGFFFDGTIRREKQARKAAEGK
jgi:hypothetical protein